MQCDVAFHSIGAYMDGELSVQEMNEVRAHIVTCQGCAAELANLVNMKRGLRGLHEQFQPSMEFRKAVRASISPKPSHWRLLNPMIILAGVLAILLVMLTAGVSRYRQSNALAEIADLHVAALASTHPLDVVSSDHHTVKPWFQGRIPFTFNIPEFAGTDFQLLGGRVMYFQSQPGAQLIVAHGRHEISVMIFQAEGGATTLPAAETFHKKDGFNIESWQGQGLLFVLISDADKSGLRQLGKAFEQVN
jgi:anti-sigma factor RsiW